MQTYQLVYDDQEVEVSGEGLSVVEAVEAAMLKWQKAPWSRRLIVTGKDSNKRYDFTEAAPTETLVVTARRH